MASVLNDFLGFCCLGWPHKREAPLLTASDFPPTEKLWEGGDFLYLGSGIYYKKILFINVKASVARRELRRLQDEGFFKGRGYTDDSLTAALNAGKFRKCLQIQMLRSATVSQFDSEISKDLRPRLERTGDQGLLQAFLDYFKDKSFTTGTTLLSLWEEDNVLTGDLFPPGFNDFADAKVSQTLPSENFCRALYDMYIGPSSIVPDGRSQFAQGALELLKA
ncbi:g6470 [Coccomyxa elongata]